MLIGLNFKKKFENEIATWNFYKQGLNTSKILANEIAYNCHYDNYFINCLSLKFLIKEALKAFILSKKVYTVDKNELGADILYLEPEENRKDYSTQSKFFLDKIKNYKIQIIKFDNNYKVERDLKKLPSKIWLFISLFVTIYSKNRKYSLKSFLYYSNRLLESQKFKYDFENCIKIVRPKVLITFYDMKRYGNLATQLCNNAKIKTITQQHAIYFALEDHIFMQPAVNYLNLISNYIFVWGQYTIDQFKGKVSQETKMILAGANHPEYSSDVDFILHNHSSKAFGILFSAEFFSSSNKELFNLSLSLARRLNYKVTIFFHPTNQLELYEEEVCKNYHDIQVDFKSFKINDIDDYDFFCCHTTTLIYPLLKKGKICFRYFDNNLVNLPGPELFFTELESLQNLVLQTKELSTFNIKENLKYVFGNINFDYDSELKKIMYN